MMQDPLKKDRKKGRPFKVAASANKAPESRRDQLLEAAAILFADKGYAGTSMRDIAEAIDMTVGSIYYHFESKEHILLNIYSQGVDRYTTAIRQALEAAPDDAWQKLEYAAIAHLTTLVEGGPFTRLGKAEFIQSVPVDVAKAIIQHRDRYELEFTHIIAGLALKHEADRFYLKVFLLSALNSAVTWYKSGMTSPAEIARNFVRYLRDGVEKA